jgi:hypothetical protein
VLGLRAVGARPAAWHGAAMKMRMNHRQGEFTAGDSF